jgi:hypothetical protein
MPVASTRTLQRVRVTTATQATATIQHNRGIARERQREHGKQPDHDPPAATLHRCERGKQRSDLEGQAPRVGQWEPGDGSYGR